MLRPFGTATRSFMSDGERVCDELVTEIETRLGQLDTTGSSLEARLGRIAERLAEDDELEPMVLEIAGEEGTFTALDFLEANEDMEPADFKGLEVGGMRTFGGGASAEMTVRRIA